MLSKPDCGWTTFQLGSENTAYCLGYLTDVAMEWLDRAIHGLETEDVFSVHGFCEPGRMVCTVSFWNCYVIFEGDGKDDVCEATWMPGSAGRILRKRKNPIRNPPTPAVRNCSAAWTP